MSRVHPSHAELYWHALHGIETLYTIMGAGCVSVSCTSTPYASIDTTSSATAQGRVGSTVSP